MSKTERYLLVVLVFILIIFGIRMSIKCSKLEQENTKLKQEYVDIIDSVKYENEILNKELIFLNKELEYCSFKIDSLKAIKEKIISNKEYIVSENIIDGVTILKNNLK